jgi:hypothetical protein
MKRARAILLLLLVLVGMGAVPIQGGSSPGNWDSCSV